MAALRAGGPEVIVEQDYRVGSPAPDEVLVRHASIGVNFVDTYYRSGLYPSAMPLVLGREAAGVVEAVGSDVRAFAGGDRVAYATGALGAYCTRRLVPQEHLIRLPDAIVDDVAAGVLLKGMTTAFLAERCARVVPGQRALVLAAAGGVGMLLTQWLRALGVRVAAHVSSEAKRALVAQNNPELLLSGPYGAIPIALQESWGGVDVVFDGVGADTWAASLASLATHGLLVSFGNASGPVPAVSPLELMRAGSVFLTRPTLHDFARDRGERQQLADRTFSMLQNRSVRLHIGQTFSLTDAADAHRALESRATTGSTVLDARLIS